MELYHEPSQRATTMQEDSSRRYDAILLDMNDTNIVYVYCFLGNGLPDLLIVIVWGSVTLFCRVASQNKL